MLQDRIVTLLTDFGFSDTYVGVMKGVMSTINPQLMLVDLTHQIPPQNIAAGRFHLLTAYPFFPPETVHLAIVDPGVGRDRRAVAIAFAEGFLVGPDNGLFSGILSQSPALAAVELTNPRYWRICNPSATFHGRDIFAPVAAHLASGVPLQDLGSAIEPATLTQLPLPDYHGISDHHWQGLIQAIDHFGNLVTNVPGWIVYGSSWAVQINGVVISGQQTYGDRQPGDLIALIGSHGWIEIAVTNGSAAQQLSVAVGAIVEVRSGPECIGSPDNLVQP